MRRRQHSLLAALFLALFACGDGGFQVVDALLFHSHPVVPSPWNRLNGGDNCHAERCDLGAPVASLTRADPPASTAPVVPLTRRVSLPARGQHAPLRVPGPPLGARAPPRIA